MQHSNGSLLNLIAAAMIAAGIAAGCSAGQSSAPASAPPSDPIASNPQVGEEIVASCYGCHSDQSPDPWYARLAPSRWATGSARQALDFSQWNDYPADKRSAELGLIASVVASGDMPPADYTFFDGAARMGSKEKQQIAAWASHQAAAPAH